MRFDGFEIKVTLADDQTQMAVKALRLPSDRPRWQIFFCEDVTAGVSPGTPLLDQGVILRARKKPGGKGDTTVKLRPCRRSQLTDHWLAARKGKSENGEEWEFKVEGDWAGERRVLAASCSADRPDGVISEAGHGGRPVKSLFVAEQLDFLRDCSEVEINLATLTVLPPVTATRWNVVEQAPPGLGVRVERWTAGELDFLELSVVAETGDVRAKQTDLTRYVHSLDLAVEQSQDSKTRQVLEYLMQQVPGPC